MGKKDCTWGELAVCEGVFASWSLGVTAPLAPAAGARIFSTRAGGRSGETRRDRKQRTIYTTILNKFKTRQTDSQESSLYINIKYYLPLYCRALPAASPCAHRPPELPQRLPRRRPGLRGSSATPGGGDSLNLGSSATRKARNSNNLLLASVAYCLAG